MLNIPLSQVDRNQLATIHANGLLGLIKKRLKKKTNTILRTYFTSEKKIIDLLKVKPEHLKNQNNAIISQLVSNGYLRKAIMDEAKSVFDYTYFFSKHEPGYSAFDLCAAIGLMTCPYCNINFANTIHRAKAKKLILRPPLDHFLAYSRYPFVALSFYNLIPSCWICNSSFKTQQDTDVLTHLNPYIRDFGKDCQLDFKDYSSINDLLAKVPAKYRVYFNNINKDARFDGNLSLFKLDDCYNEFKAVARRSLIAAMTYNEDTVAGIAAAVHGNKEEAYRMIFHSEYDASDHHLLPFSKINSDIVDNYGSQELKDILGL
nr:hypothetical protein [uncultured Mucilaginibacter sp.]